VDFEELEALEPGFCAHAKPYEIESIQPELFT